MMMEEITSSFYITLISDLKTYSSNSINTEDDYALVQAAIYDMLSYTGFNLYSIDSSNFDNLLACLKSAASAIACTSSSSYTCTTFIYQQAKVAEIVYLYLEIFRDKVDTNACFYASTIYQKASDTAYDLSLIHLLRCRRP